MIRRAAISYSLVCCLFLPSWASAQDGTGVKASKEGIITVPSRFSGVVAQVLVQKGTVVRAGDVLVRLDTHLAEIAVKEAQIRVKVAQTQLIVTRASEKAAKSYLDRVEQAVRSGLQTMTERDSAQMQAEQAQAQLIIRELETALAQVQLQRAERVIRMHAIVAPVDGTVMAVTKMPGEAVNELGDLVQLRIRSRSGADEP